MLDMRKKDSQNRISKIVALFVSVLCFVGCSGNIKTAVCTIKAGSTIDLPLNRFKITQSDPLQTKYKNDFSPYLFNRFKIILAKKLLAKGLKNSDESDIEFRIVEFNLLNRELNSVKIEIYSRGQHLETLTYRSLDLGVVS